MSRGHNVHKQYGKKCGAQTRTAKLGVFLSSSFIRTLTVGFGISPNLLTPNDVWALAGSSFLTYRRWGISPRPENNLLQ
ncbi:hypothetical protein SAMN02745132_02891 [Enterovibrio nigricans DSM 22720]|uniref:Uncharacterized protein n=1 Tax=Enterovibrio nigricans DSM 22720 TaxID=1121868 RepID=A0A1T4UZX7_9GAMM|nr:hypothetical protein SAMN02745132_02891 [Enterovibrio nigricans DSM 22720]